MKIGVITDCFKKTHAEGIELAAKLGLDGVQIYATTGEFSPSLSAEEKNRYKALLEKKGLEVSALCGDMGGYGFEIEEDNAERIEKTKAIVDLAEEFGTKVITTHIGVIPEDKAHPRYAVMLQALTECGLYAKSKGITLAIETGPEKAKTLLAFLQDTKGGVGVNLDPANFTMVTGQDAVEAVYILKDYIVHTHAKDGVMLDKNQDPTAVYHAFAVGGVDALNACEGFQELPLGEGGVDWKGYLLALQEIGYDGYLTIERECGDQPTKDIEKAVEFLKNALQEACD
jgi:sugar phosphate isomerase/epimerase